MEETTRGEAERAMWSVGASSVCWPNIWTVRLPPKTRAAPRQAGASHVSPSMSHAKAPPHTGSIAYIMAASVADTHRMADICTFQHGVSQGSRNGVTAHIYIYLAQSAQPRREYARVDRRRPRESNHPLPHHLPLHLLELLPLQAPSFRHVPGRRHRRNHAHLTNAVQFSSSRTRGRREIPGIP